MVAEEWKTKYFEFFYSESERSVSVAFHVVPETHGELESEINCDLIDPRYSVAYGNPHWYNGRPFDILEELATVRKASTENQLHKALIQVYWKLNQLEWDHY